MRNFRNNKRRFRSNSFDRSLKAHSGDQNLGSSFSNVSEIKKRNFSRNNFNSTKLIQKYSELAREALSGGDKILYENYLQHAEHFIRISENSYSINSQKNRAEEIPKKANLENLNQNSLHQKDQPKIEEN